MNNKGFTLVEILSVIVLIGLLMGIGIPGISRISQNMKQKSLNTKINLVEEAGVFWGQNNKSMLQTDSSCTTTDGNTPCKKISIRELIEEDYLDSETYEDIVYNNPVDGNTMLNNCVYIYKKNNRVKANYSKNDVSCIDEEVETPEDEDDEEVETPEDEDNESKEEEEGTQSFKCSEYELVDGTFACKIVENAVKAKEENSTTGTLYTDNDTFNLNAITGISATTDRMLVPVEDDYGTSYVFRGAVKDNYVNFAGFTWRIVRINGDGSVRLILDLTLNLVSKDGVPVHINYKLHNAEYDGDGLVEFNHSYGDNAFLGYMHGELKTNSTSYDEAHQNKVSSKIKTYLEAFYEEYLRSYQNDIADSLFCGDKTLASASIGSSNKATGFGKDTTFYAATERLYYSTGTTLITTAKPTLKCASEENATDTLTEKQRSYSRYTSNIDRSEYTSKGVLVNNDLTYPIGLLSADELVMAGAFREKDTSYYLNDALSETMYYPVWFTMTPHSFLAPPSSEFYSFNSSKWLLCRSNGANGVRPVINLKAGILLEYGDGTSVFPYTVKVS